MEATKERKHHRWQCWIGYHRWSWPGVKSADGKYHINLNDYSTPDHAICAICGTRYKKSEATK